MVCCLGNIGHNLYQAKIDSQSGRNDYILQAKRLQTPGESTLGLGKTTLGEKDIGRNDRKPHVHQTLLCPVLLVLKVSMSLSGSA